MQWIEVNVAVTHEAVEAVADMLTSIGSKGVAIEDPQLINDLRNSGTDSGSGYCSKYARRFVVFCAYRISTHTIISDR